MTQFTTKPENEAKRLRAFELFLSASIDGKRRSLRSISHELGVALSTVQYWRDQDGWEQRVREALLNSAKSADIAATHARMAVREGLLKGLNALNEIIEKGGTRDKIAAVKELANIAVRLQAIDPNALLGPNGPHGDEWQDDLPEPAVNPVAEPTPVSEELTDARV